MLSSVGSSSRLSCVLAPATATPSGTPCAVGQDRSFHARLRSIGRVRAGFFLHACPQHIRHPPAIVGNTPPVDSATEISQLIDLVKQTIHPAYLLQHVLKCGIAFHYGNMPLLIRTEIERLFTAGQIFFLVCTSTLVEGVNTSCKTITVRGPKKGRMKPMNAEDFWNLAGRAGRLGKEFQGNIVCVDANKPELWYRGSPPKARKRYTIERTTDSILADPTDLFRFIADGTPRGDANRRPDLEYVFSYLMLNYKKHDGLHNLPWAMQYRRRLL